MHQIKEMLKKMDFVIVAAEVNRVGGREDDGFFVAERDSVFYRVDYYSGYHVGEPVFVSVRKVEPKEVTKVEYL